MRILFVIIILLQFTSLCAQDETIQRMKAEAERVIKKDSIDSIPRFWKTGGLFSLALAQGSLSNWAAGGDQFSLSVNSFISSFAFYKSGRHSWDHNLNFNLGFVKTTSLGNRKNDDRLEYLSKYGYAMNPKLNLSGLFNIRTQLFKGYRYPEDEERVYSSAFFAPAYLLLSPGIDYRPQENFSFYLSPATARWILVRDTSLATFYGVDAGKKSDFQFGAYASLNFTTELNKTVSYTGRVDLFSNYRNNPKNIDLYMTNLFAAQLSKVLSVSYALTLVYDDDVKQFGPEQDAPRMQLQSMLGAGLMVHF